MMKFFMVCLVVMCVCASSDEKNHNGDHHETLCGLLGAAVQKWKTTNHPAVKKALGQAIFGSTQGGWDLNKFELHPDFNKGGSRGSLCGKCLGTPDHYPGKSIPHDLLCLCTMGKADIAYETSEKMEQLCGRNKNDFAFGKSEKDGWHSGNAGHEHVKDTWEKIVKPCLNGGSHVTIEGALKNLTEKITSEGYARWEGGSHQECGGYGHRTSICVRYHGCGKLYAQETIYPQWWETLEAALRTPNLTEDQLNSTTFLNASLDMDHNPDGPYGGHGAGTSSSSSSQQAGSTTHHPDEPRNRLLSMFSKHDSTSLPPPHSWLLSAVFFF